MPVGAAPECDLKCGIQPLFCCLGGADIGLNRDVHADKTGCGGKAGAHDKAECRNHVNKDGQQQGEYDADEENGSVLPLQISPGAFFNRACNLLHAFGAGIQRRHPLNRAHGIENRSGTANDDHNQGRKRQVFHLVIFLPAL